MAGIDTILFDLDGTLLDTAQDLTDAVNHVLRLHRRATIDDGSLRGNVSNGALAMLRQAPFGIAGDDPLLPRLREQMLDYYAHHLCVHTCLFPGLDAVLDTLQERGLRWGVVTNKPARFTDPLMECLDLSRRAACVVSGDTTARSKPDPEPLYHACRLARTTPVRCVYLGDARRDIEAGRNAGMATLVAGFGYIGPDESTESWAADGILQEPRDLLRWLAAQA